MIAVLALLSGPYSYAIDRGCDGILYINSAPPVTEQCSQVSPENFCCYEGGAHGVYENGAYFYDVPSDGNYDPDAKPTPTECHYDTVCDGGGAGYSPPVCVRELVCSY
jgi:hypothetical protein